MDDAIVRTENLVKYFDGRCVLDGIDLEIKQGTVYGLLGRNGTGKTTIIRILLGHEPPTRGQSFLYGTKSDCLSASLRSRIGYVAEAHKLIQNYKVHRLINLCKELSRQWNTIHKKYTLIKLSPPNPFPKTPKFELIAQNLGFSPVQPRFCPKMLSDSSTILDFGLISTRQ
ncbi:MAG: ATP-binding cassette domain-containing protein [Sedimentisphaerales bacterium]|nr:ATP-binding cassette domain-containing protein [Sedimentisphaerales bacterium]